MYCQHCGEKRVQRKECHKCGTKYKRKHTSKVILLALIVILGTIYLLLDSSLLNSKDSVVLSDINAAETTTIHEEAIPSTKKDTIEPEQEIELTEVIANAQGSVYTIFSNGSQGSGFLYNKNGAVVTNAHVVEGEIDVSIKTLNGEELAGTVIGYSSETDVAVIVVPALTGKSPYPIEVENKTKIGEKVIALGSPLGLENTATMGYITGKDRDFMLGHYTYENIIQISAPIAPGSSGGPLVSKEAQKIVAINSAKSEEDTSIGFSIPIYKVAEKLDQWIKEPMTEEAILAQFYDVNGGLFFGGLWEYDDGYFDGGEYSDDDSYYNYYDYDYYENEYYDEYDEWHDYGDEYESDSYLDEDMLTVEEYEIYMLIEEIEYEINLLEQELNNYPYHSEEYGRILDEQIELYDAIDELIDMLM